MKSFLTAVLLMYCVTIFSIDHACAQASPSPAPTAQASATPVVVATPIPIVTAPSGTVLVPLKDEAAAPPVWIQSAVAVAEKLPVVGPYIVTLVKWLSILVTVLTILCGAAIGLLKVATKVSSWAELTTMEAALENFENGKVLYYLKFFSAFNAQKPVVADASPAPADPGAQTAA